MTIPSDQYSTSMSLLDRAVSDEQGAWQEVTDVYSPLVYHWCRKSGLDADDAADVMQEVFRSLVKHLHKFRKQEDTDRFRAWLWTITRNKLRDFARMQRGKPTGTGGSNAYKKLMELPEEESSDMSQSAANTITNIVRTTLEKISHEFETKTYTAFYRVALDGHAAGAVAEELGISVDSVYQAKSRVLRRLRQELAGLI